MYTPNCPSEESLGDPTLKNLVNSESKAEVRTQENHTGSIQLIRNQDDKRIQSFKDQVRSVPSIVLDLETTGLNPLTDEISLVGVGIPFQSGFQCWLFDVLACPKIKKDLMILIAGPQLKILHNAKFDRNFLKQHWNLEVTPIFDTMHASQILNNGRHLKHSLVAVAQRELGVSLDKDETLRTSFKGGTYSQEQLEYVAEDLRIPWQLFIRMLPQLKELQLVPIMTLEACSISAFADMELNGFHIDQTKRQELEQRLKKELTALELKLPFVESTCVAGKEEGKDPSPKHINFNSSTQIKNYVSQQWGIELESTDEKSLSRCKHPQAKELFDKILRCRHLKKRLNTYIDKFAPTKLENGCNLHGRFFQLGTSTGRVSSTSPNLQNIPRGREFRELFIPREGNVFVICDYGQIELRVAADLAGETRMIEAIQQGQDLHRITAAKMFEKSPDEINAEERQRAKAVNFGLIYAMSAKRLVDEGISKDQAEAEQFIKSFFELYPAFRKFHHNLQRGAAKIWNHSHKEAPIKTPRSGRLRWLSERELWFNPHKMRPQVVLNHPVQGLAADGMKAALTLLKLRLADFLGAKLLASIHDEVIVECPESDAEVVKQKVEVALIEGMQTFLQQVTISVDASISKSWAGK